MNHQKKNRRVNKMDKTGKYLSREFRILQGDVTISVSLKQSSCATYHEEISLEPLLNKIETFLNEYNNKELSRPEKKQEEKK